MKILIIPDIHNDFTVAESIISNVKHDKIIFLGDYFDDFYDTIEETEQVAQWLKNSMNQKNRIHLLGNHDLAYLDQNHICTGFTRQKLSIIQSSGVDLSKLLHYCWAGDWLCTHAGLSNDFYLIQTKCPSRIHNDVSINVNNFLEIMENEDKELLYNVSFQRGGRDKVSGIVWCDYNEFKDINGLKQIFGHTKGEEIRHKHDLVRNSEHYCIDTGLKHYAIFDSKTNEMIVDESKY